MARQGAEAEEIAMAEAARRLGMTQQGVGVIAKKEGAPVVMKNGRFYCLWPQFPIWYRQEMTAAKEKPAGLDDSKARKLAAEAELAELDLAERRGEMLPTAIVRQEMRTITTRLRAQILAMPSRFAPRTVNLASLTASQSAWDAAARDLLQGLADGTDT